MMASMIYQWGARSYRVPAQVVGEEVQRITNEDGYCPPSRLVSVASDVDSPLHPLFTWDDVEAAENWRVHEARNIINSITVKVHVEGMDRSAPAFISVGHTVETQSNGEGYRPLGVVMQDEEYADEALREALGRLRALQRRYGTIKALSPVWRVLDRLESA